MIGWCLTRALAVVALGGLSAGCVPSTVGGVRGYTAFLATARVERHVSAQPAPVVADCFRRTAKFLPRSTFVPTPEGGVHYRLAGYGLWFEEILFTPDATGSTIEIRSSGAYAGNWVRMLVRDRLEPLGQCIANKGGSKEEVR